MRVRNFLKVFTSYLVLVLLTIVVLDLFLTPRIRDLMTKSIEDDMFHIAQIITLMPRNEIEKKVQEIAGHTNLRVTLIDGAGKVIADSQSDAKHMDNHLNRPEIQQAKEEGRGKSSRFSVTLQESMLYIALPLKENGEIRGYIRLARPLVQVRKSIENVYWAIHMTLFIIAIPSLILAFLFSRVIVSRLTD